MNDIQSRFQSPLGRPLDPRYRSNVLVLIGSIIVGAATAIYNVLSENPLEATAVTAGVGVFMAWAIAREIDPDSARSALLAMAIAAVALPFAPPSLLAGFGLLLATRLATGTVGKPIGVIDAAVLTGFGAFLGAGLTTPAVVPALAIGVAISGNRSRLELGAAAATALAGAATFILVRESSQGVAIDGWTIVMLLLVGGASAVLLRTKPVQSTTDIGDLPIDQRRLGASRLLIGLAFVVAVGLSVSDLFATGGAAIIAVALDRAIRRDKSTQPETISAGK